MPFTARQQTTRQQANMARSDPASQSNYLSVRTTHLDLDWAINWTTRIISGSITHSVQAAHNEVHEVIFDSSYLVIKSCTDAATGEKLQYKLDERHPVLGNALHVSFAKQLSKGEKSQIKIEYETTEQCTALGWLEADQTASGNYPFLYSQCQAIHMRSLAPVQDTPAVKATCES
jgi:leukotriene-A4 hydrolase